MWRAKGIKLSLFPVLLTPAKFSASRFQQCAKALCFPSAAWEGQPGWTAVQDRDTGRLLHPFPMTPPACLSLLCSFRLPLLGWLPGVFLWARGFCQHNCQSTIAANICLLHPSLSSNRISFFSPQSWSKLLPHTCPWPLADSSAGHISQEYEQISMQYWCGFTSFPHICLSHLQSSYKKRAISILSFWIVESNSPWQKHPVCSKFAIWGS